MLRFILVPMGLVFAAGLYKYYRFAAAGTSGSKKYGVMLQGLGTTRQKIPLQSQRILKP
jgi:hypothetical protein